MSSHPDFQCDNCGAYAWEESDFDRDYLRRFKKKCWQCHAGRFQRVDAWCYDCDQVFASRESSDCCPTCPNCGGNNTDFLSDMEDLSDDSWMFPNGHDDGEAVDTQPWDRD